MKIALLCLALGSMPVFALAPPPVVTPEPGTFMLLGLGVAGLGMAAWRRTRKR